MNSSDFSIVVQGPILGAPEDDYEKQKTLHCLQSIKGVLPDAEIILSTWKGSNVDHLFYDQVVFNEDPGAISYNDHELKNVLNNTNRQIVSTSNGLKKATRRYSIKMRGDFILLNTSFYSLLDQFQQVHSYKLFTHRVLVPTYVCRDPEKIPLLYHISDLFQIGHTEDLQNLWDIPLQPEPQTTRAFPYKTRFLNNPFHTYHYSMRFAAEQYIWYAFTKKMGLNLDLNYFSQIPSRLIIPSTLSILDNFVIAEPEQLGIKMPERIVNLFNKELLYTYNKWKRQYEAFCVRKSTAELKKHKRNVLLCSGKSMLKNVKRSVKNIIGR